MEKILASGWSPCLLANQAFCAAYKQRSRLANHCFCPWVFGTFWDDNTGGLLQHVIDIDHDRNPVVSPAFMPVLRTPSMCDDKGTPLFFFHFLRVSDGQFTSGSILSSWFTVLTCVILCCAIFGLFSGESQQTLWSWAGTSLPSGTNPTDSNCPKSIQHSSRIVLVFASVVGIFRPVLGIAILFVLLKFIWV